MSANSTPNDFDVVVIGSGFGGSVVACRLAQADKRVLVLERGQPYPPGSFPRTPHGARRFFWDPGEGRYGLFDVLSFSGLHAIVASGLGGGSLIYANVMLRKDAETFEADGMPLEPSELEPHYAKVLAEQQARPYPFVGSTPKARAMFSAASRLGRHVEPAPLAVAFGPGGDAPVPFGVALPPTANLHNNAPRSTCRLCGECNVGCNYGAKHTLDFTYLTSAVKAGAQIYTCCEAYGLSPPANGGGWSVRYRQHLAAREGHPGHLLDPVQETERSVTAGKVVVAAGTFGTTGLLLRNRASLPRLSRRLGAGICANGDLLMLLWEAESYVDPSRGPVITTSIRVNDNQSPSGRGFLLQDAGAPAGTEWLWQGVEAAHDLKGLRREVGRRLRARLRRRGDPSLGGLLAQALGSARTSAAMMPMLGLGRDLPEGRLTLRGDRLQLERHEHRSRSYYEGLEVTARSLGEALGGRVYRPFGSLTRELTVHPLGGCPMGLTGDVGVVNRWGKVFGCDNLFVADGSILPGPVGVNPSLTIAALAERIAQRMLDRW